MTNSLTHSIDKKPFRFLLSIFYESGKIIVSLLIDELLEMLLIDELLLKFELLRVLFFDEMLALKESLLKVLFELDEALLE